MKRNLKVTIAAAVALAAAYATQSRAEVIVAQIEGDVTAVYYGSNVNYENILGLRINGLETGITGLSTQRSSFGDELVLGHVKPLDQIEFFMQTDTGDRYYSSQFEHWGMDRQVRGFGTVANGFTDYVFKFAIMPNGQSQVGGFDLPDRSPTSAGAVPEPASWAMMIAGFGMIGASMRRKGLMVVLPAQPSNV